MAVAVMSKNASLLMIAAMLCPALAGISGMATLDAASAEFMASMGEALAGSDNNSSSFNSISLHGRENLVSSSRNLSPGGGYYSTHPISIGQGSGSRTEISNADSGTSMSHEVGSAREMARKADYLVQSSGNRNALGRTGSTTTQMRIEESVTDGKVNMGVLVEDGKAAAGQHRLEPLRSAWRNPAIEMEEEYIGTFNISKNLTYNSNYSLGRDRDCWLNCCGDDGIISLPPPKLIRADDVFNCHR